MAHQERRVSLTHDRDFGAFIYLEKFSFTGIIYLRPGHLDPSFTITSLKFLLEAGIEVHPPFMVVAENTSETIQLRIRHLGA